MITFTLTGEDLLFVLDALDRRGDDFRQDVQSEPGPGGLYTADEIATFNRTMARVLAALADAVDAARKEQSCRLAELEAFVAGLATQNYDGRECEPGEHGECWQGGDGPHAGACVADIDNGEEHDWLCQIVAEAKELVASGKEQP